MNYGRLIAGTGILLSFAAALGYLIIGDYRRSAYNFFGGCISLTVWTA